MLLPIKAICDRRPRKDDTSAINIQYCLSSEKRTVLSTEIFIPATFWKKKQSSISEKLPAKFGDPKRLNVKLLQHIRRTEDIVILSNSFSVDAVSMIKEFFSTQFSLDEIEAILVKKQANADAVYTNLDFFFQVDDYIKSQTLKVSEFMPCIYKNMRLHLKEFEKFRKEPITFDSLNYDFYENLLNFLPTIMNIRG